jgi:hypothetical protein
VQRRVGDGLREFALRGQGLADEFGVQDVVFGNGEDGEGVGARVYGEEVLAAVSAPFGR